eukprot:COSAG01_NODE_3747_length_5739_cov_220.026064_1_plen_1188_part_10
MASVNLPPAVGGGASAGLHWEWMTSWELDIEGNPCCDSQGWSYCGSFGSYLMDWSTTPGAVKFVRRRRWVRVRRLVSTTSGQHLTSAAELEQEVRAFVQATREGRALIGEAGGLPQSSYETASHSEAAATPMPPGLSDEEAQRWKYATRRGMPVSRDAIPSLDEITQHDMVKRTQSAAAMQQMGAGMPVPTSASLPTISISQAEGRYTVIRRALVKDGLGAEAKQLGNLEVGVEIQGYEVTLDAQGQRCIRFEYSVSGDGEHRLLPRSTYAGTLPGQLGFRMCWVVESSEKKRKGGVFLVKSVPQAWLVPEELTVDYCRLLREALLPSVQTVQRTDSAIEREERVQKELKQMEQHGKELNQRVHAQAHKKLGNPNMHGITDATAYICVHNKTPYTLQRSADFGRGKKSLTSGKWVGSCLPPEIILPHEGNVPFGSESSKLGTETQGQVVYEATKRTQFGVPGPRKFRVKIKWLATITGEVKLEQYADAPLEISSTKGAKKCAHHFTVTEPTWSEPVTIWWEYKSDLDTSDSDNEAWERLDPEASAKVERAFRSNAKMARIPPYFLVDFTTQPMEYRRDSHGDATAGDGRMQSRPVRRHTPATDSGATLPLHLAQVPLAIDQCAARLARLEQQLQLTSYDVTDPDGRAQFESSGRRPHPVLFGTLSQEEYASWRPLELQRLQQRHTMMQRRSKFAGHLLLCIREATDAGGLLGCHAGADVFLRLDVGLRPRQTRVQRIDATHKRVSFQGEQVCFLLDELPHFLVIELYRDGKVIGKGGINPLSATEYWCPAPHFRQCEVELRQQNGVDDVTLEANITIEVQLDFEIQGSQAAPLEPEAASECVANSRQHFMLCTQEMYRYVEQGGLDASALEGPLRWLWTQFGETFQISAQFQSVWLLRTSLDYFEPTAEWFDRVRTAIEAAREIINDVAQPTTLAEQQLFDSCLEWLHQLLRRCFVFHAGAALFTLEAGDEASIQMALLLLQEVLGNTQSTIEKLSEWVQEHAMLTTDTLFGVDFAAQVPNVAPQPEPESNGQHMLSEPEPKAAGESQQGPGALHRSISKMLTSGDLRPLELVQFAKYLTKQIEDARDFYDEVYAIRASEILCIEFYPKILRSTKLYVRTLEAEHNFDHPQAYDIYISCRACWKLAHQVISEAKWAGICDEDPHDICEQILKEKIANQRELMIDWGER